MDFNQINKNLDYPGDSDLVDHNIDNSLICVNFPGKVENPERAVEMLGGTDELSNTFSTNKSKLELRLRPRNIYCHNINGERAATTGLLLKVRADKHTKEIKSVNIEGVVGTEYKFNALADYNYLPIQKVGDKTECLYPALVPEGVQDISMFESQKREPLFLPPHVFSRVESTSMEMFRKETEKPEAGDESLISTNRANRRTFGISIPFSLIDDIPQQANRASFDSIRLKLVSEEKTNQIKQLFQQRPVWVRKAICAASGISTDTLKSLLPVVAYFYTTGPWRTCWVRFGYDPRKDFHARYYQPLDFRVRKFGDMKEAIQKKTNPKHRRKGNAVFDETTIPDVSLTFYQYCDIKLQKVQDMLAKVPQGICHEKRGWLPQGFDEQVRQLMSDVAQRNYSKSQQVVEVEQNTVADEKDGSIVSDFDTDYDSEEAGDSQEMSVDDN